MTILLQESVDKPCLLLKPGGQVIFHGPIKLSRETSECYYYIPGWQEIRETLNEFVVITALLVSCIFGLPLIWNLRHQNIEDGRL
jgi:hypothetical protein